DDFLAIAIPNRQSRHEDALRLCAYLLAFVREEFDGGIHVWPKVRVRGQDLHFYLHRGFRPFGLGRHFRDHAVVLAVRESISCDYAFLFGVEPGEIVLRDIEFHLEIVEIGQGDDQALRAAFGGAGESRSHELAFFRGPLENSSRYRGADHGGVEQRLGVIRLSLGLLQRAAGARYLFLPWTNLGQLETLVQGIHPLLVSFKLGRRIIQGLLRQHTFGDQAASTIERDLVIDQGGPGFLQIVLSLLNFLGTGSILQFFEISVGILGGAIRLFELSAEFIILQAHQDLAFLDLVALLYANPLHPACHFGIQVDLVVGHNVAAGRENDSPYVAALRGRTHHFYFWDVVRKQTVRDRNHSQQNQNRNPDEDVAASPDRRFALATGARRAID